MHTLRGRCVRQAGSELLGTCSSSVSLLCAPSIVVQYRFFDPQTRLDREQGFGYRMKDIPVLTGNPRPVSKEPGWTCAYKLSDRMEAVIPDILKKNGWTEEQIEREMSQIFYRKTHGSKASLNTWSTVEEFQRTPWYRRFRPTDDNAALYISYEAIKILEDVLIPPSLRSDPYSHLRKRHLEDNWLNDKFSEEAAKYVKKGDLDKMTRGSDQYGTVSRKKFLEFDAKFKKEHDGPLQANESYNAWLQTLK